MTLAIGEERHNKSRMHSSVASRGNVRTALACSDFRLVAELRRCLADDFERVAEWVGGSNASNYVTCELEMYSSSHGSNISKISMWGRAC